MALRACFLTLLVCTAAQELELLGSWPVKGQSLLGEIAVHGNRVIGVVYPGPLTVSVVELDTTDAAHVVVKGSLEVNATCSVALQGDVAYLGVRSSPSEDPGGNGMQYLDVTASPLKLIEPGYKAEEGTCDIALYGDVQAVPVRGKGLTFVKNNVVVSVIEELQIASDLAVVGSTLYTQVVSVQGFNYVSAVYSVDMAVLPYVATTLCTNLTSPGYPYHMAASHGVVYLASTSLVTLDTSTCDILSEVTFPHNYPTDAITYSEGYAYVAPHATPSSPVVLSAYNVANPRSPSLDHQSQPFGIGTIRTLEVAGGKVYAADVYSGLFIFAAP